MANFFTIAFYLSSAICIAGIVYRIWTWIHIRIGPEAETFSTWQRIASAIKGFLFTLLSFRLLIFLKVLILHVIFQARIFKGNLKVLRLSMHLLIFTGFLLLLLMHALEEQVTEVFFSDYASTLNPFMFLRNLFGAMVLLGLAMAWFRRKRVKNIQKTTNAADVYAIVILVVIMTSGFLLESVQIISSSVFDQMVEDYTGLEEPEEVNPLKLYWAREFSVVFSDLADSGDQALFEEGMDLHEENCMDCHTRPQWAFVSYPVSRFISPVAITLNKIKADVWLWTIHVLACFFGLAYLPFSKFFHIIAGTVSLLGNGVADKTRNDSVNAATLRAVALDACTHCGTCSFHCSVAPVFQQIQNRNILPSEKLITLKRVASGKSLPEAPLKSFQEGSFICTMCFRCTDVCPVGINLQDLWDASKKDLIANGLPEPFILTRDTYTSKWADSLTDHDTTIYLDGGSTPGHLMLSNQAGTFSVCFKCRTCTNACPVVANYENPEAVLGMTPHQIMHSLSLGLGEMILGSRMIWDCTTCYLCQQHCPQGVRITDIFFELKNLAHEKFGENGISMKHRARNIKEITS